MKTAQKIQKVAIFLTVIFFLLICIGSNVVFGFDGDINNDGKIGIEDSILILQILTNLKTMPLNEELQGLWKITSMVEGCSDDPIQINLPVANDNGLVYGIFYKIEDKRFRTYFDIIQFPTGAPYSPGIYYCSEGEISSEDTIRADEILADGEGTSIRFHISGDHLIITMNYAHEPDCFDTYFCIKANQISTEIENCSVFEYIDSL